MTIVDINTIKYKTIEHSYWVFNNVTMCKRKCTTKKVIVDPEYIKLIENMGMSLDYIMYLNSLPKKPNTYLKCGSKKCSSLTIE